VTFESNILAVKIRLKKMVVALTNRVYLIDFFSLEVLHIIPTFRFPEEEPYNLISMSNDPDNMLMACPTVELGHVLLVNVDTEKQRRIRAHQSSSTYLFNLVLNSITITLNGDKLATASEKGINIRIFNTSNGDLLQEVRRGNEYGMIYSLSFSRTGSWLCCTSDSNIVHFFASLPSP
jgi:WD40 repeat protein